MSCILDGIKHNVARAVNQALLDMYPNNRPQIEPADLVYPPQSEMGDLSLPCFVVAKQVGASPAELASALVGQMSKIDCISGTKAVGPYFNITLKAGYLAKDTLAFISEARGEYGHNTEGAGKRIMVEYSNGNTHKEYHIGHIRNVVLGDAVNRLLAANGYQNIPVSYVNDFGIHVAKTLWLYNEAVKDFRQETGVDMQEATDSQKGWFLGRVYARAAQREKEDKTAKGMIEFMMKKIEEREGQEYDLWQRTREWSIAHFARIYEELGVEFEHIYYESEFIDEGRRMVNELLKKGILQESEGAVIADLEKYGLGVLVFVRSDGTATYPVADLPLARHKIEEHSLDSSVYVVDVRQSLYFKQLFKVIELMGYECKLVHLGYEFVKLPSGMMSSRSGNILSYEELKNEVFSQALKETEGRHPGWQQERAKQVAWILARGAIKFEMAKVGAQQTITFDINQALQFEGYTAAYLQYTYARISGILKKAKVHGFNGLNKVDYEALEEPREKGLVLRLAKFPEEVKSAVNVYDPSVIARYLFDLARAFNDYYHAVPVIQEDERVRSARLKLVLAISQVLANGLNLLGIEAVEDM